jgi:hypothetical protein
VDLPPAPPRGPAIDIFNFGGGRCRTCRLHPQWVRHRCLQLRWWSLPDMPGAPLRGPSIDDVSSFSGGHYRTCRQHPRGSAIDVFTFGGGRYWTCHQHPPGGPRSTCPTSGPPALAPPGGPSSTHFLVLMVGALGPPAPAPPPRGPAVDCQVKSLR